MKSQKPSVRFFYGSVLLAGLGCLCSMLSVASPTTPPVVEDSVKEPESGTRFPTTLDAARISAGLKHPTLGASLQFGAQVLSGVGIREKTIFGVDVYAMGLYLDPSAARSELGKWANKSAKDMAKDAGLYRQLLKAGMPTTLRLVMCRDVDGEDMAEAFDDSLGPRMKSILARDNSSLPKGTKAGSMEDLKSFRRYFDIDEVKDGVELLFTWDEDGVLYTRVSGKFVGGIHSFALCQSLFDIFLGDKPISKSAKKGMVKRLPGILKG